VTPTTCRSIVDGIVRGETISGDAVGHLRRCNSCRAIGRTAGQLAEQWEPPGPPRAGFLSRATAGAIERSRRRERRRQVTTTLMLAAPVVLALALWLERSNPERPLAEVRSPRPTVATILDETAVAGPADHPSSPEPPRVVGGGPGPFPAPREPEPRGGSDRPRPPQRSAEPITGESASRSVADRGILKVYGIPDSRIFVDGVAAGRLPLWLSIEPGKHSLRVVDPDGDVARQTVDLVAGRSVDVVFHVEPEPIVVAFPRPDGCGTASCAEDPAQTGRLGGLPATPAASDVAAGISAVRRDVLGCGTRHAFRGTIIAKISIAPNGGVTAAEIVDYVGRSLSLPHCVTEILRRAHFPRSTRGITVNYPIVFR
jgi:hypothetical protein